MERLIEAQQCYARGNEEKLKPTQEGLPHSTGPPLQATIVSSLQWWRAHYLHFERPHMSRLQVASLHFKLNTQLKT